MTIVLTAPLFAATGTLFPQPWLYALDSAGNPVSGAKACFYTAGTSTPATTYSDVALTTPNTNPVVADPAGRVGPVFLTPGQSYKLILQDATGTALTCNGAVLKTQDNISAIPGSAAGVDLTGTAGEALTAGQAVYLSDGSGAKTAGQWYKADSANTYSSTLAEVGIVPSSISSGSSGTIRIAGSATGLSSLTVGAEYFVGTAGALTSSAPANKRHLGHADTTSSLVLTADPSTSFGAIVPTMTNGQLIIGSTGVTPVAAALTAGTGISTTTGAGTLTVTNTGAVVLDRQVTTQTVSNTTTETAFYTYAVPGGTLSTNRTLHLSMVGDHLWNSGVGGSLQLKAKYGATTIFDGTIASVANGANRGSISFDLELQAHNATNAQAARGFFELGDTAQNNASGVAGSLSSASTYTMYATHTSVAEDSTASKNLVLTVTFGSANASIDLRCFNVYTEVK